MGLWMGLLVWQMVLASLDQQDIQLALTESLQLEKYQMEAFAKTDCQTDLAGIQAMMVYLANQVANWVIQKVCLAVDLDTMIEMDHFELEEKTIMDMIVRAIRVAVTILQ